MGSSPRRSFFRAFLPQFVHGGDRGLQILVPGVLFVLLGMLTGGPTVFGGTGGGSGSGQGATAGGGTCPVGDGFVTLRWSTLDPSPAAAVTVTPTFTG